MVVNTRKLFVRFAIYILQIKTKTILVFGKIRALLLFIYKIREHVKITTCILSGQSAKALPVSEHSDFK